MLNRGEGNISMERYREFHEGPARSRNLSMHGKLHAREPGDPTIAHRRMVTGGTLGEGRSRTPEMYERGKSDRLVVSAKPPNKAGQPAAEVVEKRSLAKGNTRQQTTCRTQRRRHRVKIALARIREAAQREKGMRFTALLHHVTVDLLHVAYESLRREAAPGVDDVTWYEYGQDLDEKIRDLHRRVHRGAYQAKPTRRAYIPKADGSKRALGIASLEDKIVQKAVVEVMSAIYEVDFKGFSYGYRPGRNQHQALDAVAVGIDEMRVSWVLDADIRGCFDTIDHEWLIKFVEHRIADKRIIRLLKKWLKAGVMEGGQWKESQQGTPQGATISSLLANIYLHYALDLWIQSWRKRQTRWNVFIVRYADDFIVGFQKYEDAARFRYQIVQRLAKFGMKLNEAKTRLIEFGRYAAENRAKKGKGRPDTFNFLGFTHACAISRKGKFFLKRMTDTRRMQRKLSELNREIKRRRHQPISVQGAWLRSVVQGHFNYYAVPGNADRTAMFRREVVRAWRRALNRRSQRGRVNWKRMKRIAAKWLPEASARHPFPSERLRVTTRGRSPVR